MVAGSVRGMALSAEEREQFLAEPHIGALSVVERPDRAPLTIPLWYQYNPGGELWVRTLPESRKMRAIKAAGRFGLMAQRTAPTVRYVSVEGPVTRIEPDTPERAHEMAARYLPAEKVGAYLEFERTRIGEHVVVFLRPERWLSLDMGAF
ncbi:pyridoxamine 5'-phosphate oxidase family protein [Amycolatopsis australiensis]|uniref:pyridoxamine 5'-phosphate oxidase family protein n=1 Tax=Amycolatopsis australiensis TaxID=546364 RepID=UPI003CCB8AB6